MSGPQARALWSFYLVLFCWFKSVQSVTYWLDASCNNRGQGRDGVADAMNEMVWVAGRVADALDARDVTLQVDLFRMFGFDYAQIDDTGTPWVNYVSATYRRISQLTATGDRASSDIRIMCDNHASFRKVNKNGDIALTPGNIGDDVFKRARFWDQGNDAMLQGRNLGCFDTVNPAAQTIDIINDVYEKLKNRNAGVFPTSSQNPNRAIITICDKLWTDSFQGMSNVGALTWRDLATTGLLPNRLQDIPTVAFIRPNLALALMHELIHVGSLSGTTFQLPAGGVGENAGTQRLIKRGTDLHPSIYETVNKDIPKTSGYYIGFDRLLPGERLQSPVWTCMNPDSYAYMASIYRLRDKQWDVARPADSDFLIFYRNLNFGVVRDWPGAPPQT